LPETTLAEKRKKLLITFAVILVVFILPLYLWIYTPQNPFLDAYTKLLAEAGWFLSRHPVGIIIMFLFSLYLWFRRNNFKITLMQ